MFKSRLVLMITDLSGSRILNINAFFKRIALYLVVFFLIFFIFCFL